MDIIKPYEWIHGTVHGHTKEESKRVWDSAWEFINNIDILSEYKEFSKTNPGNDLCEFRDFIEKKYEYSDEIGNLLFNIIGIDEFGDYLKMKYPNIEYYVETIETHKIRFKS